MFERYLVENNLYDEAGGFEVIGALYEDPDAYAELLVSERLRGLARCMMEVRSWCTCSCLPCCSLCACVPARSLVACLAACLLAAAFP